MFVRPYRLEGESCGIPIIWWSEVYLYIVSGLSLVGLLVTVTALASFNQKLTKSMLAFGMIVVCVVLVCWTCYGFSLFISEEDDCAEKKPGWYGVMILLLILGFCPFIGFAYVNRPACCLGESDGSSKNENDWTTFKSSSEY